MFTQVRCPRVVELSNANLKHPTAGRRFRVLVPEPEEFEADIAALESLVADLKAEGLKAKEVRPGMKPRKSEDRIFGARRRRTHGRLPNFIFGERRMSTAAITER